MTSGHPTNYSTLTDVTQYDHSGTVLLKGLTTLDGLADSLVVY